MNARKDTVCVNKSLQKNCILGELRRKGLRITKQRRVIIDAILDNEFSCCKEIYWEVIQKEPGVGIATIYRLLKLLEDIGAINRRNMYRLRFNEIISV